MNKAERIYRLEMAEVRLNKFESAMLKAGAEASKLMTEMMKLSKANNNDSRLMRKAQAFERGSRDIGKTQIEMNRQVKMFNEVLKILEKEGR